MRDASAECARGDLQHLGGGCSDAFDHRPVADQCVRKWSADALFPREVDLMLQCLLVCCGR